MRCAPAVKLERVENSISGYNFQNKSVATVERINRFKEEKASCVLATKFVF